MISQITVHLHLSRNLILLAALFLPLGVLLAQTPVQVSVNPGYLIINTDYLSDVNSFSEPYFIYGANAVLYTDYMNRPVQLHFGYTRAHKTVFTGTHFIMGPSYSIRQRYHTFPVEPLISYPLNDRVTVAIGPNVVMQYRSIHYDNLDITDDRLLSFGAGFSGQVQLLLNDHFSERLHTYLNISSRWTEFFLHNSRGRDTSDYRYRHMVLSPQLGFRFHL